MPDASASAIEKIIQLILKPWTQQVLTVNYDQVKIIEILKIPFGKTDKLQPINIIQIASDNSAVDDSMQHPSPKSLIAEESFDPEANHRVFNEPQCIHCDT